MKLSLGRSKRSLYVEIVDILTYEVSAELVEFQRHPRLFKLRKGGEGVNENIDHEYYKYFHDDILDCHKLDNYYQNRDQQRERRKPRLQVSLFLVWLAPFDCLYFFITFSAIKWSIFPPSFQVKPGFDPTSKDHGSDRESSTFTTRPWSFPFDYLYYDILDYWKLDNNQNHDHQNH